MVVNENTILTIPNELLIDYVVHKEDNRYNEDVYLLYNPVGYGGVLITGKEIVDLIRSFDGKKNVDTVLNSMNFTDEQREEAKNFLEVLVEKDILLMEGAEKKPASWCKELTCWLHITNDCNLRCRYCYIHKDHSCMSDEILYKSIDMMIESCKKNNYTTLSLMLVGGEPLTRFDKIKEIVSYCSENCGELNIRYIIPTNGTLITDEVAQYIVDKHISVGISIDGTEEYHDANRVKVDGSGSFRLAMRGVDTLLAHGVKPSIMVTVTEQNLDGLPELTELMINKKLYFRFSFERDTQTGNPGILKDENHCIEVMKKCFKIMETALLEGRTGWFFKFGDVSFGKPRRRSCAAGKNFFSIGQDGSIGSCSLGLECPRSDITKITDVITDIDEIFADISKTSACDVAECKQCIWRHSCGGACPLQTYATYKTLMNVSPYCALYKACLPSVIRIHAMTIYYNNRR